MRAAGLVLVLAGAGLACRSALLLLGRGRPRRGPRPALVLAGPYLRLRNPLAAGILVALAGAALLERSLLLGLVAVEEPRLRTRFGVAYSEYLRRVPRWLPRRRRP